MSEQRRAPKRPIEKVITMISHNAVSTTLVETQLRETASVETLIRVVGSCSVVFGANPGHFSLAVIKVPEGYSALNVSLTDSTEFYEAPSDVLWAVAGDIISGGIIKYDIDVKGMRKLKVGDKIIFVSRASTTDVIDLTGVLTSFYKQ